jgi:hypothetical protein
VDWVEESGEDLLESGFGEMIVQGMHLDGILWITIQSFPPVIRSSNNTLPDNSDVLIESADEPRNQRAKGRVRLQHHIDQRD